MKLILSCVFIRFPCVPKRCVSNAVLGGAIPWLCFVSHLCTKPFLCGSAPLSANPYQINAMDRPSSASPNCSLKCCSITARCIASQIIRCSSRFQTARRDSLRIIAQLFRCHVRLFAAMPTLCSVHLCLALPFHLIAVQRYSVAVPRGSSPFLRSSSQSHTLPPRGIIR